MGVRIAGISHYFPEKRFSNDDFFELFPKDRSDQNLLKIGVQNRHISAADQTASDLAVEAAKNLFNQYGIDPKKIDFVLFCAQEFDHFTPSTACLIQNRLGISTKAGALDYNLGCTGFVYGLSLAKGLMLGSGLKNVLLLTASTLSRRLHEKDKSARFIFGDGAAATLISASDGGSVGEFVFGTDGGRGEHIIVRDGGARNPIGETSMVDEEDEFGNVTNPASVLMNGTGVFVFGIKTVPVLIKEVLEKNNLKLNDVDHFVFHQANAFMIETLRNKIGIPGDKFHVYMSHCGNTVSSTIPIVLEELMSNGKLESGQKVLLAAFGTGLSWAATVIEV